MTDVVIAGAGPNGLMLACELSLAGVRPIVLEQLPAPSEQPKANGLVGQVVKMLDRRGLYERLSGSASGEPPRPAPGFVFGALPLDLTVLADNPIHLLHVGQVRITEVMRERAAELGVRIRWGHAVTGLSQNEDSVTLDVTGPDGPYRLDTGYLVGADGGRSVTRKLSGIGFPGVTTDDTIARSAYAALPAEWVDRATATLNVPGYGPVPLFRHHRNDNGLFVYAPFPDRPPMVTTIEWGEQPADDVPMTLREMRASVGRVLGVDADLTEYDGDGPHLLRRLTCGNTRLADRFRDRRVLLVGDAAHVHSAIGGPGLNLGLQDAINLGWKLAAEIRGEATPELLDTYEAERRPVAQRVVMHTMAQSALIAPGGAVTALRELFTELLDDPANVGHIAGLMAGSDIRYDPGSADAHPLVGRWAKDMVLRTPTGTVRLAELTRDARALLLDLTTDGSVAASISDLHERVTVVTATQESTAVPATALLIRPDSYVAWASSSSTPDSEELAALRSATRLWFGARESANA
jgi:2-polyprenyl-6-methoxyphenol hydroxylase-like FAD-dependent oxidoreductase